MTITMHGSTYPLDAIPQASVQGGQPLRADILQVQAGRTRHIYEFLAGAAITNVAPCAPTAPHGPPGVPGHSHAGGTDGCSIVRTLYSAVLGGDDGIMGTDISGGRAPQQIQAAGDFADVPLYLFNSDIKLCWIPACGPDGSYIDGLLTFYFQVTTANVTMYMDWSSGGFTHATQSQLLTTGYYYWSVPNRIALHNGRLGVVTCRLWMVGTHAAGGSTVSLLSIGIHQTKTTP